LQTCVNIMNIVLTLLMTICCIIVVSGICPNQCKCKQNKHVECTKLKLKKIPENIPVDTVVLSLRENEITNISYGVFDHLVNLNKIDLSRNKIKIIPNNIFKKLNNLKFLKLDENEIEDIRPDSFYGLHNLSKLVLGINNLKKISKEYFSHLLNLKSLDISANYLTDIPPHVFRSMLKLEELEIYDNEIKVVRKDMFGSMPFLTLLDLSFSYIESIEPGTFDRFPRLETLALQDNELTDIRKGTLVKLTKLNFLMINNRQLNCTCDFIKQTNILKSYGNEIEIDAWCTYPKYLNDREVQSVENIEMKC